MSTGKIGALLAGVMIVAPYLGNSRENDKVGQIMAEVAANQDRAQESRAAFLYTQDMVLRFKRGNGQTAREEIREYTVTPGAKDSRKSLTHFVGRYENRGKLIEYAEPGFNYKDLDIDGDLIDDLAKDLADEKDSRDGFATELFPLTSRQQSKYEFTLHDIEEHRGRNVYKITFKPRKNGWSDDDGTPWAGEILVDEKEFQPVFVSTRLARGLPIAVKTLLGTNLKGLGFKLTYDKFDEGLWFPVTYGAEFEVKAVFFYRRKIAIAVNNKGFKRAVVETKVSYDEPLKIERTLQQPEIKVAPSTGP